MNGSRLYKPASEPLVYILDPDYPGNLKALYEQSVPVMRVDLLEAIRSAGVGNLEVFPAIIRDPESKKEYDDYRAFNIVGVVACADRKKSKLMGTTKFTMIDTDFAGL